MPAQETRKIAPRLRDIRAQIAASYPDKPWKEIHALLEEKREGLEYLGKPGTTQKAVAETRKKLKELGDPEEKPWRIDMVEGGYPVSADALGDVLSAWRWHKVGQGVPFTVRMAKWISRLRFLAGTEELEKRVAKFMDNPKNLRSEDEIRGGLLTMQSLRLAREAVAIASEELACIALGREFDPTSIMVDLSFGWLDQPADVPTHLLRAAAKKKTLEQLDRASVFSLSVYQAATTAQSYGWNTDDYSWTTELRLDPLDRVAAEVLNTVVNKSSTNPVRDAVDFVLAAARDIDWEGKTQPQRNKFVDKQLLDISTGKAMLND